jgi:hypothetical protein
MYIQGKANEPAALDRMNIVPCAGMSFGACLHQMPRSILLISELFLSRKMYYKNLIVTSALLASF